jgi:hypothetical protein
MRRQLAHLLVGDLDQRLAFEHVVVGHDLGDVVDRPMVTPASSKNFRFG